VGASPLPLVPDDEQGGALEALGLTQPISLNRSTFGRMP
jgi:two-component system sensor histidine kinase MtrB